ncbi:MAG TPA: ECF transporter S component, partial [Anaerolineae bacterium]|nr:ECF transporter S component [Anaerolineae bacterium]
MKRLTTRDLVYIAVFGALWGAMEITLGSYLHAVFPQGVTPIVGAGTIMTAIGIIVALVGWLFVPRTGAVLMIGVVAAILKGFSISGVKLSPMLAIVIECLLVEVGLLIKRDSRRWGFA